jgi:preprotein translocase subunit SecA
MQFQHPDLGGFGAGDQAAQAQPRLASGDDAYANVGRNDPCPCGSNKKFKHCHGQLA